MCEKTWPKLAGWSVESDFKLLRRNHLEFSKSWDKWRVDANNCIASSRLFFIAVIKLARVVVPFVFFVLFWCARKRKCLTKSCWISFYILVCYTELWKANLKATWDPLCFYSLGRVWVRFFFAWENGDINHGKSCWPDKMCFSSLKVYIPRTDQVQIA